MTSAVGALGGLALGLAVVVGAETVVLRPVQDVVPATAPPAVPQPLRPTASPGAERSVAWAAAAAVARPLFRPGRRPASATSTLAAAPPSPPRLTGTVVSASHKYALFAAPDLGRPVTTVENGQVGSWTVQTIDAGVVTISGPGGVQELRVAPDHGSSERSNTALPSTRVMWSWNNPCGRLHRRPGTQSSTPRDDRCAFAGGDPVDDAAVTAVSE